MAKLLDVHRRGLDAAWAARITLDLGQFGRLRRAAQGLEASPVEAVSITLPVPILAPWRWPNPRLGCCKGPQSPDPDNGVDLVHHTTRPVRRTHCPHAARRERGAGVRRDGQAHPGLRRLQHL